MLGSFSLVRRKVNVAKISKSLGSPLKDRLAAMQDAWAAGKDAPPGVPDGLYKFQLQDAKLTEAMTSKRLQVKREHLIIEGEFEGEVVRDQLGLESEEGPKYVAAWIRQMGYEAPDDIATLEETVNAIAADNPIYTAQVRNKDGFTNVYVRELVEATADKVKTGASSTPTKATSTKVKAKEEPTSEFEVGSLVSFEDQGTEYQGSVVAINGDSAHVQDDSDPEGLYEVPLSLLVAREPDEVEEASASPEGADEALAAVLAFAQAHNIPEVSDQDTVETAVASLNTYEWNKAELLPEEQELLESVGVEMKEAPKPKPKSVAKPAPSKVKKTTVLRRK